MKKVITTLRNSTTCVIACIAVLFYTSIASFAQQRPDLGTTSTYAIFTGAGAINNTGFSLIVGDIGQVGSYAFNGFPPGRYTGTLNRNNAAAAKALSDLETAQTADGSVACGIVLGVGIVDGQSFDAGVHNTPFNTAQLADGIYSYTLVAGSLRPNGPMNVIR